MVIYHHHGRKLQSEGDKLFANYAIGNGALYAKYLFKDPNLCRKFYWDVEVCERGFLSGRSDHYFIGNFGFYLHTWLAYNVLGAIRYVFLVLTGCLKSYRLS